MTTQVKKFPLTDRLATPGAPTVTPVGAGGLVTWTYKVVAINDEGQHTDASPGGSTAVGNATIDGTNFNTVSWTAVDGAVSYDVYRTAHGTTPATNGKIGSTAGVSLDDTGLAGDASTAPATNTTGLAVDALDVLHLKHKSLQVRGGTVQFQGSIADDVWENAGAAVTAGSFADVARTYERMRANVTAVSGSLEDVAAHVAGHGAG